MTTHTSSLHEWLMQLGEEQKAVGLQASLGLDRVAFVAEKMGLLPFNIPTITVAGTNGKGSTVAIMEAILIAQGYRVGSFTSPHLYHANERIKINGEPVSDDCLIHAFETIDAYDSIETPSYFEFFTLSSLLIFQQQKLDYVLLEVGLGGRLDAVNIVSPEVAVITSIGLDHQWILGETREAIALEKAGIFRQNAKAVCGCDDPPSTLIARAKELNLAIDYQSKDFKYIEHENTWDFVSQSDSFYDLPKPSIALQNAATGLKALSHLNIKLDEPFLRKTLSSLFVPGRQQWVKGPVNLLLDVAHNVDSMKALAKTLASLPNKVMAVFSMMSDKDFDACVALIAPFIKCWLVAPLGVDRSLSLAALKSGFERQHIDSVLYFNSIRKAYEQSKEMAKPTDTILITGSFLTVGMAYKSGYTSLTKREKVV